MKFRVLAVSAALMVFTAAPSFAQANFSAGIKGGINFSKISFDPDFEDAVCCDMRTGFIGGLFIVAPINESIAIQPEFLYSMQGTKLEFDDDLGQIESTIKTDYFQIPVLLRADFGGGSARPFVLVGPQFGFNISAKQSGIGVNIDDDEDIKDDVKNFDFALAIGAGVQFGAASIEGRYTHGLTNANEDSEEEGLEAKHRVWSIMVGFRF
jgi:outer membrane protein with beta-barrel domain